MLLIIRIVVRLIVLRIYCSMAKYIVVPASPLAHSNRRAGPIAFRRAFPFCTCIAWERHMWVLRDLSVSAAQPQAIFLIRLFANRPRHCAIIAYYTHVCIISSITPPNGGSRQSPSSVFTDLSIYTDSATETTLRKICETSSRYISPGDCNIKKNSVRCKENTECSENTSNCYMYNISIYYSAQDIFKILNY